MSLQSISEETKNIPRGEDRRRSDLGPQRGAERRSSTADRRHKNNRQYATFFLEGHFLGVEVEKVQEILNIQEMTRVPLSSPIVAGLINLRGQIVAAIDLRIRLGLTARPADGCHSSLVVLTNDGPVNLLVDKIGDVIEVLPDLFESTPETLDEEFRSVVEGVYKLKDTLLLVINIEAVTQVLGSVV